MFKFLSYCSVILLLSGCGSSSSSNDTNNQDNQSSQYEQYIEASKSNLSDDVKEALNYMGDEERLAYDLYLKLYDTSGANQFYNIATKSEIEHITAVKQMLEKYDINDTELYNHEVEDLNAGEYANEHINELYEELYTKGIKTKQDALEVGCIVEVVDVDDLDLYIGYTIDSNASDVQGVFEYLRAGSYNHYWAFDTGLKNLGINDGCCSLGETYCKTVQEYPSSH
jgi:hypothetical protein